MWFHSEPTHSSNNSQLLPSLSPTPLKQQKPSNRTSFILLAGRVAIGLFILSAAVGELQSSSRPGAQMNADQLRERHNELLRIEDEQEKQQNILRDKYDDLEEKHNAGQIDEPAYQQKVHGRFLNARRKSI
jgi:hypothetical protein